MEDHIVYHTQPPPKTFLQLRNEATAPFVKLYYEILSRFHLNDYDQAIGAMSADLRVIIEQCQKQMQDGYHAEQSAYEKSEAERRWDKLKSSKP